MQINKEWWGDEIVGSVSDILTELQRGNYKSDMKCICSVETSESKTEWMEEYAEKKAPSKVKKLHRKETFSSGVRDMRNDLSSDYPGNMAFHGDIGPYKLLGKNEAKLMELLVTTRQWLDR